MKDVESKEAKMENGQQDDTQNGRDREKEETKKLHFTSTVTRLPLLTLPALG